MKPALTAALVAGVSFATTSGIDTCAVVSELGRSLVRGIILGANVGPYLSGLTPGHIESRVTVSGYGSNRTTDPDSAEDP